MNNTFQFKHYSPSKRSIGTKIIVLNMFMNGSRLRIYIRGACSAFSAVPRDSSVIFDLCIVNRVAAFLPTESRDIPESLPDALGSYGHDLIWELLCFSFILKLLTSTKCDYGSKCSLGRYRYANYDN